MTSLKSLLTFQLPIAIAFPITFFLPFLCTFHLPTSFVLHQQRTFSVHIQCILSAVLYHTCGVRYQLSRIQIMMNSKNYSNLTKCLIKLLVHSNPKYCWLLSLSLQVCTLGRYWIRHAVRCVCDFVNCTRYYAE